MDEMLAALQSAGGCVEFERDGEVIASGADGEFVIYAAGPWDADLESLGSRDPYGWLMIVNVPVDVRERIYDLARTHFEEAVILRSLEHVKAESATILAGEAPLGGEVASIIDRSLFVDASRPPVRGGASALRVWLGRAFEVAAARSMSTTHVLEIYVRAACGENDLLELMAQVEQVFDGVGIIDTPDHGEGGPMFPVFVSGLAKAQVAERLSQISSEWIERVEI